MYAAGRCTVCGWKVGEPLTRKLSVNPFRPDRVYAHIPVDVPVEPVAVPPAPPAPEPAPPAHEPTPTPVVEPSPVLLTDEVGKVTIQ
jgi:hypothetical protein